MATRINYVANPSVETNTTNWTAAGTVTQTRDNTEAYVGSYSMKHVCSGGSNQGFGLSTLGGLGITANSLYTATFYIKGTGNVTAISVTTYYTGGGSKISNGTPFAIPGNWTRITVPITGLDSSKTVNFFGFSVLSNVVATYYVDAMMIESGDTATAYFDGSIANAAWNGTAHASASTYTDPPSSDAPTPVMRLGAARIGPLRVGKA